MSDFLSKGFMSPFKYYTNCNRSHQKSINSCIPNRTKGVRKNGKVESSKPSNSSSINETRLTPESRENQMVYLAVDLAEQQLRDGTASSQVITHFLKLGSTKEKLEKEKLEEENKLLKAKTENPLPEKSWRNYTKGGLTPLCV